jgi:hypothetical protein
MDTMFTVIAAVAGLLLGVGVSFGTVRGRLKAIEDAQVLLGQKLDTIMKSVHGMDRIQGQHEIKLNNLESDVREIKNRVPTIPGMVPAERV